MPPFVISSLRGGLNDTDPPTELEPDQCVRMTNVELFNSTLGERRNGGDAIAQPGTWPFTDCERCVFVHHHTPNDDPADAQLWALCINDTGPAAVLAYKTTTWTTVTMADALDIDGVAEYYISAVSFRGKLFLAYRSSVANLDRLHVWDGTSLRRVGIASATTAPTAADSGGAGSLSGTRYYRIRWAMQVSSVTTLRSEPSAVLTHAPGGANASITVTRPATTGIDSHVTHWELEESTDNANFYRIATTALATTTYVDSLASAAVATTGTLSADVGDYTVPHGAVHLIADEDRLILGGAFQGTTHQSSVSWTPTGNATGVGNDERIPLDPVSVIHLDPSDGGHITDLSSAVAGEIWGFKDSQTYRITRTGVAAMAYSAETASKQVGAIWRSVVEGVDEAGRPALYWLDPATGPYRAVLTGLRTDGRSDLQYCGRDVWTFYQTVNLDATVICRGVFYPTRKQVQFRVATGASEAPDAAIVIQTNHMRVMPNGEARRGITTWTGTACAALATCLFAENIDDDTARSRVLVPFIGLEGNGLIWRMDTGSTDNGTAYSARITTKPYTPTDLKTDFEIKTGTLVAKAASGVSLTVSAIPDGGIATTESAASVSLTPAGSETFVIRDMDDLSIAEMQAVQMDFADPASPAGRWELARVALTLSVGQGS